MTYYTAITILTWVSLAVLCILVSDNDRIEGKDETVFYLTYLLIGFAALAEWTGVKLSGDPGIPTAALRAVKCLDYILTPMATGALVAQMRIRNTGFKILMWLLAANAAFQVIALFTDWMVVIDDNNFYSHGRLYNGYIGLCLVTIVLVIYEFVIFSKAYRRQNRLSLYAVIGIVLIGMWTQELYADIRTAYIAITIAAAMLFIHFTEFMQIRSDDEIEMQNRLITTDALTGALSRAAYSEALDELRDPYKMPSGLAVIEMDINGLKEANDNFGHDAGDELIIGAAETIMKVFDGHGKCYRTGGDEFVVIGEMSPNEADYLIDELRKEADMWQGEEAKELGLAVGCAFHRENNALSCEELVKVADYRMYEDKADYYTRSGKDRRRNR